MKRNVVFGSVLAAAMSVGVAAQSATSSPQTLKSLSSYYHSWRTHLSLGKDAPMGRRTQTPDEGEVIEVREIGGLHYHYEPRIA